VLALAQFERYRYLAHALSLTQGIIT
jgi:hypothetical protein